VNGSSLVRISTNNSAHPCRANSLSSKLRINSHLRVIAIPAHIRLNSSRAHTQDIRAIDPSAWAEDRRGSSNRARQTAIRVVVSIRVCGDAVVARGEDGGGALECELHPFVALTFNVVDRQVLLAFAVGDGDHGGWRVEAAFERAFVATGAGVGVDWEMLGALLMLRLGKGGYLDRWCCCRLSARMHCTCRMTTC